MKIETRSCERALDQHRTLRGLVRELQGFLRVPILREDGESRRHWAAGFCERLVKLHEGVSEHFREEEDSGVLEELTREFPHMAHTISGLGGEHRRILEGFRELIGESVRFVEGRERRLFELRDPALALLQLLSDHERKETELMQSMYSVDLGSGD